MDSDRPPRAAGEVQSRPDHSRMPNGNAWRVQVRERSTSADLGYQTTVDPNRDMHPGDFESTRLARSLNPEPRNRVEPLEIAELGRGGLGRVFVTVDMALGREVAVKEILPEALKEHDPASAAALRARFLREARVTGQLEHPNIVPVYEVGEREDGRLYYAMRWVRGKTLREAIRSAEGLQGRLSLLNHFLGLCHAIAYAHSRGVIHRDIKPQNVMIGEFGETVVLDWGVAKVKRSSGLDSLIPGIREDAAERPEQTRFGQILGTPAYMAPEQLAGLSTQVDERTDVWSLGVVLYFLLTGRLPFRPSPKHGVASIARAKRQPAHQLDRRIPAELSAIAERALRFDRHDRYQSAVEMADDVQAYLTGARVQVYDYSSWDLVRRFYGKHRTAVLVAIAAVVALLALSAFGHQRVVAARDRALDAEQRQRQSALEARHSLAELLAKQARFALARDDTMSAELLAARSLNIVPSQDARGVLASLATDQLPRLVHTKDYQQSCTELAYAPANGTIACAHDRQIKVVRGEKPSHLGSHASRISALTSSADGQLIYSADVSGRVRLWRSSASEPFTEIEGTAAVTALALSPDEKHLVTGDASGHVRIYDARALTPAHSSHLGEPVSALTWGSEAIAAGGRYGALAVWHPERSNELRTLTGHTGTLTALRFAPSGLVLASAGSDRTVRLWDLSSSPDSPPKLLGRSQVATSLAWSDQGRTLIYGTLEQRIRWVDTRLGRTVAEVYGHARALRALALTPDERHLVSLDENLSVKRWRLPDPKLTRRLVEPGNVLSLAWLPREQGLVSAGLGRYGACLWQLARAECETRLPVTSEQARALAVSADGQRLAIGGSTGELTVWDLGKRLPIAALTGHRSAVRGIALSERGDWLVSGDLAGQLTRWEVATSKAQRTRTLEGGINAVALNERHGVVAVATRGAHIELWDARLEKRLARLKGHSDWVMDVVFLPNGQLASAGADHSVRLWDPKRQQELLRWQAGARRQLTVAVSPDGRWLAAGGEDQLIRIWELDTRQLMATLRDHRGAVRRLSFSSKGQLASASDDRTIRLWDLAALDAHPQSLLDAAEKRYSVRATDVQLME